MDPLELRCFCSKRPLLAVCGVDAATGEPFIHIKAYKQKRIYSEVVVTSGTVRIHCRDCLRWQTVTIRYGEKVSMRQEPLPETIAV